MQAPPTTAVLLQREIRGKLGLELTETCARVYAVGANMPAYLTTPIAGDAVSLLMGTQVIYIAWRLTTIDPLVRQLEPSAPDHILRAGWLSLGDSINPFGVGFEDYWTPPIWLDFVHGLWTPSPSTNAGAPLAQFGSKIRWHLNGSTSGLLFVFGA